MLNMNGYVVVKELNTYDENNFKNTIWNLINLIEILKNIYIFKNNMKNYRGYD